MESVAFIQWCLDHLNYWTITLLMAIESSFIPFPSEVVVPPAAYKAAGGNSDLNVFLVVIFATIGANIGAIINYYIALLGAPVLIWQVFSATARSAIVVSSVSPERWDAIAVYPALCAILIASSVSDTEPI